MDNNTINANAGHNLNAGDPVYLEYQKRNAFQKVIFWLMFWKKDTPTTYKVVSIDSDTTFNISS